MTAPAAATSDRASRIADLLARTALADQRSFADLYRLTSPQMYAVALRILRDSAAAEEVLQEAYVNVWNRAATYDASKSQPLTWLTSIVRNRCLDRLRRHEVETVSLTRDEADDGELEFAAPGPSPVELLVNGASAKSVRQCIEALDSAQQQAIALAFYHGLSHAELAAHLREPLGTVKSWIRRGLERLKQCLDRSGFVF